MGLIWSAPRPEAEVATGTLRGKNDVTPGGTKYHAFLGIPYAKPPVGELRFKAPKPAEPWTGVREAYVEGNQCYQGAMPISVPEGVIIFKLILGILRNLPVLIHRAMLAKKQSEDCLYLNVFAAASTFPNGEGEGDKPLRPVVFIIHGGAFRMGDGNPDFMNPEWFLEKNLVVVTINYRLGPFGFLALGTADVPGNAGLKDQSLALKWTYDNIRAFGGDPNAITVYGESAGAVSAHLHQLSPLSEGLCRSVIASSGSGVVHWGTTTNSLNCARGLVKQLGIQADTPEEMAKALREVSAGKLNNAALNMMPIFECLTDELMFLPVVEPTFPGAFLTEDPTSMMRDGKYHPVPLMTGICTAEGLIWTLLSDPSDEETYRQIKERPDYYLPVDLRRGLSRKQRDKCMQEILEEYTGGKPFSKENVAAFIELFGDIMFKIRHVALLHLHATANKSPVYQYRFNFVGKYNSLKWLTKTRLGKDGPKIPGAAHGDDLWYVGNVRLFSLPHVEPDSREMICRDRMVQLWANFVETGNPTPPGTDKELIPVEWAACSSTSQPFLEIDDHMELKTGNVFPRQAFWERLYEKYLGRPMVA